VQFCRVGDEAVIFHLYKTPLLKKQVLAGFKLVFVDLTDVSVKKPVYLLVRVMKPVFGLASANRVLMHDFREFNFRCLES
jgi:hypothetical protein